MSRGKDTHKWQYIYFFAIGTSMATPHVSGVAALVKYLGIERADLMGYSLGGAVALRTAVRDPDVVRKLVLVSTPFRHDPRSGLLPGFTCRGERGIVDLYDLRRIPASLDETYWSRARGILRRAVEGSRDRSVIVTPIVEPGPFHSVYRYGAIKKRALTPSRRARQLRDRVSQEKVRTRRAY